MINARSVKWSATVLAVLVTTVLLNLFVWDEHHDFGGEVLGYITVNLLVVLSVSVVTTFTLWAREPLE